MVNLTKAQIKEIADELLCGLTAFIHKETGEFVFVPDPNEPYVDTEAWASEFKKLEDHPLDYYEIRKMTSSQAFDVMADFTDQLTNNHHLQNRLITALSKKKPLREFKFIIDDSGGYRQKWFDFRDAKLLEWVEQQIEQLKED